MIKIQSNGSGSSRLRKIALRLAHWCREALTVRVAVDDGRHRSSFHCETFNDAARPLSMMVKEEGTMRWLDREARPGDVFLDVGANVGIYTIAAAHRVGPAGRVFAFEPHKASAVTLMRNLVLSSVDEQVTVFTCALAEKPGAIAFNYTSLESASSGSQAGHTDVAGEQREFLPVATEIILTASVDSLIDCGAMTAPALVKIDVDGNELKVLRGMQTLLSGKNRPRAIQVELNVGSHIDIVEFLRERGYQLTERHLTRYGKNRTQRGVPLDQIAHNAIFQP